MPAGLQRPVGQHARDRGPPAPGVSSALVRLETPSPGPSPGTTTARVSRSLRDTKSDHDVPGVECAVRAAYSTFVKRAEIESENRDVQ